MFSSLFPIWAVLLCVFFLFVTATSSLSYFFPTQLAYGTPEQISRFYLLLKIKLMGLPLLAALLAVWLLATSKKKPEIYNPPKHVKPKTAVFWRGGLAYLLIAGGLTGYVVFVSMSSGDEGGRTNVARNLVLYSLYAFGQPQSFQIFSPLVSAGPTVILPLAFLYRDVGDGMVITRIYEHAWNLAALAAIYSLYAQMLRAKKLFLALLLSVAFLLHPRMEDGYATLMGDMAVFFFLVVALRFLPDFGERKLFKFRFLLSGIFVALAIVTKSLVSIAGVLPLAFLLFWYHRRKEIAWRPLLIFGGGMAVPFLAWLVIKQAFTNTSFASDNMLLFSSYALFGIRELPQVVGRYGLLNFFKLGVLLGAASLYIGKALREHRVGSRELAMYGFSTAFILFFFFCTHGQILRYNLHAILFLLPLAVKAFPDAWVEKAAGKFFTSFALGFVLLFHPEIRNSGQILFLKRTRELPWLAEQLREKVRNLSPLPTLWTFDEFDGCYLSALARPPVFWMRETMFHKKPRPITHPFQLNQTNIRIPVQPPIPLPALKEGDLIAAGVTRRWNHERKLYLLRVTHVPHRKTTRFRVRGRLPEELELTLKQSLDAMGLEGKFEDGGRPRDRKAYWLELWK